VGYRAITLLQEAVHPVYGELVHWQVSPTAHRVVESKHGSHAPRALLDAQRVKAVVLAGMRLDLLTELRSSSAESLVVDGWAVGVHAEPRDTKDLERFAKDGSK